MKKSLTTLSLVIAAGFPCSILAEFAGLPWPASLNASNTFGVFVAVLTLLTVFSDYSRNSAMPFARAFNSSLKAPASPRAAMAVPAFATEERRLAA